MIVGLKYTDTALPTGSAVFVLFSTAAIPAGGTIGLAAAKPAGCPMANWGPMNGLHSYHYDIKHDQIGTVLGYRSADRGVTWSQFYTSGSLAIPTLSSSAVVLIEGLKDFAFVWSNTGTVTQTTFVVDQDCSTFP
jgi:hypothetical protein